MTAQAKPLDRLIEDLELNHEYCPKEVILQAAAELRRLKAENEKLAATRRSFAGATIWLGDSVATQVRTEAEILHERVQGQSITQAAQKCLNMLAAKEMA